MGSGGHTNEMITMIEQSIQPMNNSIRRYIINADDQLTRAKVLELEKEIRERCTASRVDAGTFDIKYVQRARRVRQSWVTTPFSAIVSVLHVLIALIAPLPTVAEPSRTPSQPRKHLYPDVVVSNGPGTGFVALLCAHVLRTLGLVPLTSMRGVFIESTARFDSLSLSARLIRATGVADRLIVQHEGIKQLGQYVEWIGLAPAVPPLPVMVQAETS
jgi:beta-1,4-N-acetylglucosaminyltransferase